VVCGAVAKGIASILPTADPGWNAMPPTKLGHTPVFSRMCRRLGRKPPMEDLSGGAAPARLLL